MKLHKLVRLCEHNELAPHTSHWEVLNNPNVVEAIGCPGGVFLPDDTLIIEKVDGEWPKWVSEVYDRTRPNPYAWESTDPAFDFLNALSAQEAE